MGLCLVHCREWYRLRCKDFEDSEDSWTSISLINSGAVGRLHDLAFIYAVDCLIDTTWIGYGFVFGLVLVTEFDSHDTLCMRTKYRTIVFTESSIVVIHPDLSETS